MPLVGLESNIIGMIKDGPVEKAVLEIYATGDKNKKTGQLPCWFNPTQYSISRSLSYRKTGGIGQNGNSRHAHGHRPAESTMSVSIYLDKTFNLWGTLPGYAMKGAGMIKSKIKEKKTGVEAEKQRDVLDACRQLEKLTHVRADNPKIPLVCFNWGGVEFLGRLSSINITYTLFERGGEPSRAKVDLTIVGDDKFFINNKEIKNKSISDVRTGSIELGNLNPRKLLKK